jgi:hypothetical protein
MSVTYQVKSLDTLAAETASLDQLSRSLLLNSIVSCDGQPLGRVTHRDLVFFSRTWAGWALEEWGEKPPEESLGALSLIDQWLQDPGSCQDDLEAAWSGNGPPHHRPVQQRAAAWAARVAVGPAGSFLASARTASEAAWASAWAAEAAAGAAEAAAESAVWAARAAAYQRQGRFIVEHLKNSSQTSFPFSRT